VSGNPARILNDNWGLYGIIDQLIWRVPGSEDPTGVGIFARFVGAPEDRNLIDFYFDGGFTFSGMIPGRPDDAIAIGFAYTGISDKVSAFDLDSGEPVARNYESLIEVTYTYQINAGWAVQPTFQYVFQPGGNVADIDDAAVVGARSSLKF
jgi:porin